jgi:hypothetical protein
MALVPGSTEWDVPEKMRLATKFLAHEFIPHGGILFKVYVVGQALHVVPRPSLCDNWINDVSVHLLDSQKLPKSFEYQFLDSNVQLLFDRVPSSDVTSLMSFVTERTSLLKQFIKCIQDEFDQKLSLFGFDLILDSAKQIWVVDLNYFPGYEGRSFASSALFIYLGFPDFHRHFGDLLLDVLSSE